MNTHGSRPVNAGPIGTTGCPACVLFDPAAFPAPIEHPTLARSIRWGWVRERLSEGWAVGFKIDPADIEALRHAIVMRIGGMLAMRSTEPGVLIVARMDALDEPRAYLDLPHVAVRDGRTVPVSDGGDTDDG